MPIRRVHLVPHTHWDREWYKTAEAFRVHLLPLVDEVLSRGEPFLLDGQAIVLEDLLAWRPDLGPAVGRALRDGWLEAGPWYVLADNAIPSGEALVRNLEAGRESLGRHGATAPAVLYCPDTFGHPAAGPTLAQGFGLGMAVAWRGVPALGTDLLRWRNEAGDEVLLHRLPPSGYEFGSSLPTEPAAAAHRWFAMRDVLAPGAPSGEVLVLNGADHHARQGDFDAARAALRSAIAPATLVEEGLRGFAASQRAWASRGPLPVVRDELRASPAVVWTLGGTGGSRAHQKRANAHAERLLVHDVEPWLALAAWHRRPTDRAAVAGLWRLLLACHPHDTLCGCSIDDVALAMEDRLRRVMAGGSELRRVALGSWRSAPAGAPLVVQVTNPVPRQRSGVVEGWLDVPVARVAIGPGSAGHQEAPAAPRAHGVRDGRRAVPMQRLTHRRAFTRDEAPDRYPRTTLVDQERVLLWVEDLPALGWRTLGVADRPGRARPPRPVAVREAIMDNGVVRAWWDAAEGLCVSTRDATWTDVLGFSSEGERGDLYTHSAVPGTWRASGLRGARVTMRGPLRAELTARARVTVAPREVSTATGTPVAHREGHVDLTVRVQLDAGAAWIRVVIEGRNTIDDFRLRALWRTHCAGTHHLADAAFAPVWRADVPPSPGPGDVEVIAPTGILHRFVSRYAIDASRGATIVSDGLAEYEAHADGTVAITLVRAVGELSRTDLPERPGHAGYPAEVPLAQCHGPFAAVVAFVPHGADSPATRALVEAAVDDVLLPPSAATVPAPEGNEAGGPALDGEGLRFLACRPWGDGALLVRCSNVTGRQTIGSWSIAGLRAAHRARLDGTLLGALAVTGDRVRFAVPPHAVATFILARQSR